MKQLTRDMVESLERKITTVSDIGNAQRLMAYLRCYQLNNYDVQMYIRRLRTRFGDIQRAGS